MNVFSYRHGRPLPKEEDINPQLKGPPMIRKLTPRQLTRLLRIFWGADRAASEVAGARIAIDAELFPRK